MKNLNKVRILHIVGTMNTGGTETMIMNIYRNIDRSRVQFDFISYSNNDGYYDNEIKKLGGRIIKVCSQRSVNELCRIIKENGPYKAIHAHTLFNCGIAMLAAKKCGIKCRISHAHTNLDSDKSIIKKIYINLMRYSINKNSTKLLACSNAAGYYLFGSKSIKNNKYSYFPNIINYSKFIKSENNEVIKFKNKIDLNNKIVIGHIGRFVEAKNHKLLIDILKNMVDRNIDANLLLVGDGPTKHEIENLAKQKNIYDRVKFVGIREDTNIMLQSMDVFVFPSIYEGLGLVMLEAQASGVPCVVSEAIQPEADLNLGLINKLSLDDDINVWVDCILKVATNNKLEKNKIIKAFEISGYSVEAGIDKLMNIYGI